MVFHELSVQKGVELKSFSGAGDACEACYDRDGKLFLGGGSAIYECNPEDGTCKRVFKWMELGILQSDVNLWWPMDEEHLGVILSGGGSGGKSVLILKRIPREHVAEKETLILGSWGSVGTDLEQAIATFNRGNADYQVRVLDYTEKLNPASTREDFFPEVLEASRRQGKLLLLPKAFSLQTLVCKKKVLEQTLGKDAFGEEILNLRATWDVAHYMAAADCFPDAEVTQYSALYEREGLTGRAGAAVEPALLLNQDSFANEDSKQCSLDGELFAQLLAFGARRGKIQVNAASYGEAFERDQWLFYRTEVYGFSGVQAARILFGKPANKKSRVN